MVSEDFDTYLEKGKDALNNENLEIALDSFNKAIKIGSKDVKKLSKLLYLKGVVFSSMERHEDAIKCYDESLKKNISSESLNSKALSLNTIGKYEKALKTLQDSLNIDASNPQSWQIKGEIYLIDIGDLKEAEKCFDKALEIKSDYVNALIFKGLILFDKREYGNSLTYLEKANQIEPNDLFALKNLAIAHLELKNPKKALEYINNSLKLDYEDALSWKIKGDIYQDLGKLDESEKCFDKAIEIEPEYVDALIFKGLILFDKREYGESLTYLEKANQIEPNKLLALINLARAHLELKNSEKALEYINNSLKLDYGDPFSWQIKGEIYQDMDLDKAGKCFDKALKIKPDYTDALNSKGFILIEKGNPVKAISCYEKVLEIDSKNLYALYEIARAHHNLDQNKKALKYIDLAIAIDESHGIFWRLKGEILSGLDKYQKAIAAYDKAIELDPEYTTAFASKGRVLWTLGRFEEALSLLDKSLEIEPEYIYAFMTKGEIYSEINEYEKALDSFNKVLKLNAKDGEAWLQKGIVLEKLGKFKEAKNSYQKFIENKPQGMEFTARRVKEYLLNLGKLKKPISLKPSKKTQYWQWSTRAEYFLNPDGSERTDLEPSTEQGPEIGLYWTCHKDTRLGDLVLLYRAGEKDGVRYKDIKYLIQAVSDSYTIDDIKYAFERGWQYGCDYKPLFKFENPLRLEEMHEDSYLKDWNALRANFRRMVYKTEERHWNRLNELLVEKNPEYGEFLKNFKPQKIIGEIKTEKEVEDKLVENLHILEKFGYNLELEGRQVICKGQGGFIDLLCKDKTTSDYVIIELKVVKANRNVFGQISYYMGWALDKLSHNQPVKAIVISRGYDNNFKSALKTNPHIEHIELSAVLAQLGLEIKN